MSSDEDGDAGDVSGGSHNNQPGGAPSPGPGLHKKSDCEGWLQLCLEVRPQVSSQLSQLTFTDSRSTTVTSCPGPGRRSRTQVSLRSEVRRGTVLE